MARKRDSISPDITPLIDVVFILLIFFIVSSVFKQEQLSLQLNLPSSNGNIHEVEIKQISIELSHNSLALNGKAIDFSQFENKISLITDNNKPIIVRIDQDVKYNRIIRVFDILQKYSLNNLALVTEE